MRVRREKLAPNDLSRFTGFSQDLMPHGHLIDRANRPQTLLFDHLVGAGKQRGRHVEAERLGGLQVDNEIEARGLFHW